MPYQLITNHTAANYTKGRGSKKITRIVIHHWDDPAKKPSFDGVIRWFENPASKASAHYVVEAGKVARVVAEGNTAWHAGNWAVNQTSIGIECNPRASEKDKTTVGELINDIRKRHGNIPIVGHKDIVPTGCPGRYYPPNQTLVPYIKDGGGAAKVPAKPAPAVRADIESLADAAIRGEYGNGEERKRRLGSNYAAVQKRVNEKLAGKPATPSAQAGPDIDALADAVIRGEYGNGETRKRKLGSLYAAVQQRVNEKLA